MLRLCSFVYFVYKSLSNTEKNSGHLMPIMKIEGMIWAYRLFVGETVACQHITPVHFT